MLEILGWKYFFFCLGFFSPCQWFLSWCKSSFLEICFLNKFDWLHGWLQYYKISGLHIYSVYASAYLIPGSRDSTILHFFLFSSGTHHISEEPELFLLCFAIIFLWLLILYIWVKPSNLYSFTFWLFLLSEL